MDESGRIWGLNATAAGLLGWKPDEPLPPPLAEDVARALAAPTGVPRRVERAVTGPDGGELWLEVSITATNGGAHRYATLFVRDLTASRRAERLRSVEHRLARLLAAARTGAEAAREALELVATGLGFDHGELWIADPGASTLRLTAAWRRDAVGPFADAARRMVLGRGEDLAGLAWEIGEPLCVDDAAALEGLARADAIALEGIRGGAALPIRVAGEVVGVTVLARRGGAPLDAELRQTLHALAVLVSHFAERRRAERRLADETVALAAVARATRELTRAVDVHAVREAICAAAVEAAGATYAFLATPDNEHGGLVVRCFAPVTAEASNVDLHFPPDAPSAIVRAFESRRAVFLADVADDPGSDVERARAVGVVSGLIQPIIHDDEALGVLGIGWATRQATLDGSTRLLVRLLAGEAAIAMSRAELVARLEAAARTDPLTGLTNLRGWEEHLIRELAAAARDGRPVAVALLDLDGFKALNDRVGHQGGDRVLRSSAAAWRNQLREGDLLARLGGDEFAVLLPGCEPDHAIALAERLRGATQEVTTSVGVAYWDGEEPYSDLMTRADAALYAAKAAGRDRVASR